MMRTLPAVAVLLLVAACSGSSSDTTAGPSAPAPTSKATATPGAGPSTKPGELPRCADVWADGKVLPSSYRGCVPAADASLGAVTPCDRRPESYATYTTNVGEAERAYFALVGGKVIEYTDDEDGPYAKAFDACLDS